MIVRQRGRREGMGRLLTAGEALTRNALLVPRKVGARDLSREMTYATWNRRACRLANALLGLGLERGDRVAILAYNCLEWLEIYPALAKAGLVALPINFRLVGREIAYILADSGARALIVQAPLLAPVEEIRDGIDLPAQRLIVLGAAHEVPGSADYEALLAEASDAEPALAVVPDDIAVMLYTSGTTGRPKGAMRSHGAEAVRFPVKERAEAPTIRERRTHDQEHGVVWEVRLERLSKSGSHPNRQIVNRGVNGAFINRGQV
jgi:acyl-CoA synthetase (AMP-forming)/AMP-acid ligase II